MNSNNPRYLILWESCHTADEPKYLNSQYAHIDMCSFHLARNNPSSGNRLEKNDDPMMVADELFMK